MQKRQLTKRRLHSREAIRPNGFSVKRILVPEEPPRRGLLLSVCFFFALCLFGMYYEFCGAIGTVVLTAFVLYTFGKRRSISIRPTVGMCVYLLFLAGYVVTAIWAVDSGMAFLGLGKILWIAPFLLLYQQAGEEERGLLFRTLPWMGLVLAAFGGISRFIPPLSEHLWVNGRLVGSFQYPNTFAVFLLLGIVVLLYEETWPWKQLVCFAGLCVGIAFSGSRTVMVLSAAVLLLLVLLKKRWRLLLLVLGLGAAAVLYIFLSKDTASIGRILRLSLTESTFVGRLLYARDALPLLASHPFGMGYLGYYYSENMVQTGVYTVRFIHNDWLQIGLDIGWVPMLAYGLAVLRCVFGKGLAARNRWMLAVLSVHGLLDFDLSFSVMLCLAFLLMDDAAWVGKKKVLPEVVHLPARAGAVCGGIAILLGVYLAIPTLAEYAGGYALAAAVCPFDTEANLYLLSESEDIETVEELAERVLRQNDTCALAYYAKAFAAYCRDDYEDVISYQRKAIARDYFNYEEYSNYAQMLYDGMQYAEEERVRGLCREELQNIPALMDEAMGRLSYLGKRIADQPELEMEEELKELVEYL